MPFADAEMDGERPQPRWPRRLACGEDPRRGVQQVAAEQIAGALLGKAVKQGRLDVLEDATGIRAEIDQFPDQVAQLRDVLGRTIDTIDVPLDASREQMLASGMDPAFVDVVIDGAELVRDGGNAIVTDEVERIVGRPPRSFRTWADDHRNAFG